MSNPLQTLGLNSFFLNKIVVIESLPACFPENTITMTGLGTIYHFYDTVVHLKKGQTNNMNYLSAVKFLSKYIMKFRRNFLVFFVGWLLDMVLSIVMAVILGLLVDEIVYYKDIATFLRISMLLMSMILFLCILYFLIYAQHQYLMNMFTFDIKKDVFEHIHMCDAQYMSELATGEALTILQSYTHECMYFVVRNIIHFINGILKLLVIVLYLLIIDWRVGIFILLAAPLNVYISTKFGKKTNQYSNTSKIVHKNYISWLHELLPNIQSVRLWRAEDKVFSEFQSHHTKIFKTNIKSSIVSITTDNITGITNLTIQLLIFFIAGVISGVEFVTIGDFTLMLSLLATLIEQIKWTSSSYVDAQKRLPHIQHIKEMLSSSCAHNERNNTLKITAGEIVFDDVSFSYKSRLTVLDKISFLIKGGETTALIGKSGSGKSTVAYMLTGFYTPLQGRILIDGQDIRHCTLKSIRQNVGLVAQDILIFSGTIRENLLLGNYEATDDELIDACNKAGIKSFITSLPEGLNTKIGVEGVEMSGGQKQRIAIARIYLRNPKIIIFDEATSALDVQTEKEIHSAWQKVLKGRTTLIISHRNSALSLCDTLFELKNGKIKELPVVTR